MQQVSINVKNTTIFWQQTPQCRYAQKIGANWGQLSPAPTNSHYSQLGCILSNKVPVKVRQNCNEATFIT